jgi:Tol biopolymer transport system component
VVKRISLRIEAKQYHGNQVCDETQYAKNRRFSYGRQRHYNIIHDKKREEAPMLHRGRMVVALNAAGFTLLATMTIAQADPDIDVKPEVFAPGVISGPAHDSAPAFTPDGKTIVFGRGSSAAAFILISHKTSHGWSEPQIAPFSGQWLDMEPAMAPDGSYLIFASNRPAATGARPVDGQMNGSLQPGEGGNLWRIDRTSKGWGTPVRLPDSINASGSTYSPSIAGDGTLYFMRPNPITHKFQLFEANAKYTEIHELPFSDGTYTDVDPAVARDQSFMVFGSGRHANKDIDLFITFRTKENWSNPVYLGDSINSPQSDAEPRLSPDNRTLYFSSDRVAPEPKPIPLEKSARVLREMMSWNNGLYNIWMVDLAQIIAKTKPSPSEPRGVVMPAKETSPSGA